MSDWSKVGHYLLGVAVGVSVGAAATIGWVAEDADKAAKASAAAQLATDRNAFDALRQTFAGEAPVWRLVSRKTGVTSGAWAGSSEDGRYYWLPPKALQGDLLVAVRFGVDQAAINRNCSGLKPAPSPFALGGCTTTDYPKRPLIVFQNPCDQRWQHDFYALLLCHELGHANGWQNNHEGGYWQKVRK